MKVLSVNLHLFPDYLKQNELSTSATVNGIVERILALSDEPDVIVFQELWTGKGRYLLSNMFKDRWPYILTDCRIGKFLFGLNSGLAVYSKYPIVDFVRCDYRDRMGDEVFARKGCLALKLEIGANEDGSKKYFYCFNTHLQAGIGRIASYLDKIPLLGPWLNKIILHTDKSTSEVKRKQIDQAKQIIDNFVGEDANKGVHMLFAGDFNTSNTDVVEYDYMLNAFDAIDTFSSEYSPYPGSVISEKNVNRRIDYQLDMTKGNNKLKGYSIIDETLPVPYSDHMTLHGNFEY